MSKKNLQEFFPLINRYLSRGITSFLITIGTWGKDYTGDFVAGTIAFFIPFLITWAIKGITDVVTITSMIGFITSIVILILGHPKVFATLLNSWRKSKYSYPISMGILNGIVTGKIGEKLPNMPFSDYKPEEWYSFFSYDKNFNVSLISASQISEKFDIIINPFGEEYPEKDKPNRETFKQIVQFVSNGGIFVNVAGLAFYYLWDGEEEDLSGPLLETFQINKQGILDRIVMLRSSHLLDAVLLTNFGIRTTFFKPNVISVNPVNDEFFDEINRIGGGLSNTCEFRSAYRSEKKGTILLPILKATYKIKDPSRKKSFSFECYPIAAASFGRGYLILNGIKLSKNRPQDFLKEIEAVKSVAKKLYVKGYV